MASKKNGGLGISSFFALNRGLLFKWIWRFTYNNHSLWDRLIKAIHGPRGLLDSSRSPPRCSPWLDIVREFKGLASKGINLFSFIKKKVGNGEDTSFWEDQWLNDVPFKILFPRLFLLELNPHVTVANKLNEPSLVSSFRRAPRGGLEEEQLRQLEDSLSQILLPQANDRWI